MAREDRVPDRRVFQGSAAARIGEQVGQRNLALAANTYAHVLADEGELNNELLVLTE